VKFTINRIDSLKCPPGKRDMLVFDDEQRGLGVRVTASGSKTYLAQYSFHGQKRRLPLGSTSGVSLAKARDAVRAILGDVARSIDAAAALSHWRLEHLAAAAALPVHVVRNMEGSAGPLAAQSHTVDKIVAAFARRGVEFRAGDVPSVKRVAGKVGQALRACRRYYYGSAEPEWAPLRPRRRVSQEPLRYIPPAARKP